MVSSSPTEARGPGPTALAEGWSETASPSALAFIAFVSRAEGKGSKEMKSAPETKGPAGAESSPRLHCLPHPYSYKLRSKGNGEGRNTPWLDSWQKAGRPLAGDAATPQKSSPAMSLHLQSPAARMRDMCAPASQARSTAPPPREQGGEPSDQNRSSVSNKVTQSINSRARKQVNPSKPTPAPTLEQGN